MPPKTDEQILAIDPGSSCGYAHTNGERGAWDLRKEEPGLIDLYEALERFCEQYTVECIAVEDAAFGSNKKNMNRDRQALHNKRLGVILLFAQQRELRVVKYVPSTIKKFATGNGKADKEQMMRACQTFHGFNPATSDEADACFILDMATQGHRPAQSHKVKKAKKRCDYKRNPKLF